MQVLPFIQVLSLHWMFWLFLVFYYHEHCCVAFLIVLGYSRVGHPVTVQSAE